MPSIGEIRFGNTIHGDGFDGEVSRLVVDPVGRALTHVIVAPHHESGPRRLVPASLIDRKSGSGLRMRCDKEDFQALSPADGTQVVIDATGGSAPDPSRTLRRGTRAYAVDGVAGRVRGLCVGDAGITHYLVRSGVPWRRRIAAVPIGVVSDVADGVHIGMPKRRVRALPAHAPTTWTASGSPS